MYVSFKVFRHKKIITLAVFLMLALGLGIAGVFATQEERSIYVFPSTTEQVGWQGGDQVLEQTLSGNAIFDDFNPENSARILLSSEWRVIESSETGNDSATGEETEASDSAVNDTVYEGAEIDEPTPSDQEETAEEVTDGDARDNDPSSDEESDMSSSQEDVREEEPAPVSETNTDGTSEEGSETEDDTTDIEDTPSQVKENNTQSDGGMTRAYPSPLRDVRAFEYMGYVLRGALVPSVLAQEGGEAVSQDSSFSGTQANDTTESEEDPVQPSDNTEGDTVEEESTPVTDAQAGAVETGSDSPTSMEVGEEMSAPTEEDEERPEPTDKGSDTRGGDNESIVNDPLAEEDVTICGVLESDCYLLSVNGFGLGWDLEAFEPKEFMLNVSLGANVETEAGAEDKLYIRYSDGRRWHIATVIPLIGELSNHTNNGHFTFPLPEISDWHDLEDLEVQIEYVYGGSSRAEVYVESVWVDATYEAPETTAFPNLPQLRESLQALEYSAQPDVLALKDDVVVEYTHTDENEDETLIIKTDRKIYNGLTRATVHFNVTNTSERTEDFHVQVYFPESRGEVSSLKQYIKNIPVTVEEPIFQPMAQACSASWRYDELLNAPEEEVDISAPEEPEESSENEADKEDESIDTIPTDTGTVVLGARYFAQAQTTVSDAVPESTGTTEDVSQEESTELEETSEASFDGDTDGDIAVENDVSPEVDEAEMSGDAPTSSTEDGVPSSEAPQVGTETHIGDTTTEPTEPAQEEPRDTLQDAIRSALENKIVEDQSPAGFYRCPDDETVLYCDSLGAGGTNCIQNNVQIGSKTRTEYRDKFVEVGMKDGEQVVEHGVFTRMAQLFGVRPERKEVPKGFVVKDSTLDLHRIEAGQTLYFEMEIAFKAKSNGEFWIEAIGKKGAYGLLDPWWSSGWIYRMPVYVDNTNGALLQEQQVYLELDSSYSDFWNHVQEDGDDIRFLRQVEGYSEWLDTSFAYRVPITIASSSVSGNVTNFPVYLNLADLGDTFWQQVRDDGGDIRISASDSTTELPREIVAIATSTRTGEVYFQANSLSSTAENIFYVYFGSSTATDYADTDTYGAHNVWDDNYVLVTHAYDLTTSSIENSAGTSNDGTKQSADNPVEATGKFGDAQDFVNDDVSHGNLGIGTGSSTVETWIRPDTLSGSGDQGTYGFTVLASAPGSGGAYAPWLTVGGSGGNVDEVRYCAYTNSSSCTASAGAGLVAGSWYYISATAVYGGPTIVKVNETEELNFTNIGNTAWGNTFTLGDLRPGRNIWFDGLIDEVRISNIVRSDAWLTTTYENMSTSSDFYATSSAQFYVEPVTEELDFWVQYFSSSSQQAGIWVQADELEAGASTTLYMYYGNAGASSASDQYDPFTYSSLTDLYHVVRNDGATNGSLLVYSYVDDNVVQFDSGATTTLQRGEATSTTVFYATSTVRATGPLMAKLDDSAAQNYDSLLPIGFASTSFTIPPRDNSGQVFFAYAPFASTTVRLYVGAAGTPSQTTSLATGTAWAVSQNISTGDSGILESTAPILVAYEDNNNDGMAVYPATHRDLYGIFSNNNYIATVGATDVDVSCSGGSSGTMTGFIRGDNVDNTVCTSGANGTGDAVRLYNQTYPIASVQNADSDGNERSVFWPLMEFSSEYMVPVTTSYIAIACAPEIGDVSISLYNTSDTEVTAGTCSPGSDSPGHLLFGTDDDNNYNAGYYVKSTDVPAKPFYAYYEDHTDVSDGSNGGDENNFTGAVQGRKFAYPDLAYTFGAEELSTEPIYTQSTYRFYDNEDAEPPTDPWPRGAEDLSEDEEITATYAVDNGDVLRLRLGVTVTNVAVDAGDNNFSLQFTEAEVCDAGGLSWSDVGLIGSGSVWRGYDNGSLVDGSTLSSTTLSTADVFGTYEEENDSTSFLSGIGVGETIEHDWVIENNGANANSSYCFRAVTADGLAFPVYNEYPRVETNSAPEEPSTVSPFDNAKVWDLTPALQFVATDVASDDLHYQVQIDDNFDFSSPVVDASSLVSPTAFSNVTVPSDKAPFSSGNVVQYTVQSALSNGVTYYWRVRANDPNGSGAWGEWLSPPSSFTTDTSISVSTWYQTTEEQFSTDSFGGAAFASTSDDVRLGGPIGEYGQVTLTDNGWTEVTTTRTYENMIVVASPRYAGNTVVQRSPRVRNKDANSFEIKVDNYSSSVTGSTIVDYLVVEEGTYTIADGGTGRTMVAGSELVSGQLGNGCATGTPYTASWSFSASPAVFHTITSVNDPTWITTNVNDGSNNEPTTTTGEFNLMDGFASCSHTESEYIDFIAMDRFKGTTTEGVEYAVLNGIDTFDRSGDALLATPFSPTFTSLPLTYVSSIITFNGGNGPITVTDTRSAVTTSNFYGSADEDGPGADRGGNAESGSVIAFAQASGTIQALFSGTFTTTPVDFDDAEIGNRWGSVSWTDTENGGTSIVYQVEYESGGGWELVPDTEILGNSTGTSTAPIDLSDLDTADYNTIRVKATLTSPTESDTPILSDITISWQQSVYTPSHTSPFDNELAGTTTPELIFNTSDPQGDDLTYVVEWSTDYTFANASSATSGLVSGFRNVDSGGDTHPFNSGDSIGFTMQDALTVGETYWWRVRATDSGASGWSFSSSPWSFTATSSVPVSTWFQTTKDQFDNDTKNGVETVTPGSVIPAGSVGEYGTIDLQPKVWTEVTLTKEFSNPVVVASVAYDSADNTNPHQRRDVRVRNKDADSFEIKVYDYDEADEVTDFSGTTTAHWLVMEEGDWNIEAGAGSTRVIAGTEYVSRVLCSTYSGGGQAITFSPAFTNPPAVFANVSTDNDGNWAHAGVDDASDADDDNEPTTTTAGIFLGRSHANCSHGAEDIDYVAFEKVRSTNNGSEFEATSSPDSIVGSPDAGGTAVSYTSAFSATPGVMIVQQMGEDGGQGGYAHVHTGGTNNASTISLALEEDGPNADRAHTNEVVAYLAFASSTGIIERVPESISGSILSQSIVFSVGTGPKWGEVLWTDIEPSTSTSTFQVYYATNSTFALIPDSDLPGNSVGTSTSPIDLGSLDINTYSTIRILNTLECTASGVCPELYDWMVTWSEGIEVSGTAYEYDETTPLTTGTVRIALNGVLQATTGTISGGAWTIQNVNAFPDDIVTVWVDSADEDGEAVAITKYDGANDITGMVLYERHVTLGSDDMPTLTNANLSQYDYSVSGNEDIIHEVDALNDFNACYLSGCSDVVLYVLPGTTYRPDSASSGNVTTHDVRNYGHIRGDGNTIRVSGSWDDNSGFTANSTTVIFTATSTDETIDTTGSATTSFATVVFGESSGTATWTLVTPFDVNGNMSVTYGTYIPDSATTTIAGNLTIGANGSWQKGTATTTFDGTGVALWTDNTLTKQDMGTVAIRGTSKTVRLQSGVKVTNIQIYSGSTFDVSANDYALEVAGDFTNGGVFTAQEGTVTFTATTTGRVINPGPSSFYAMTFNGIGGNWAFPVTNVTAQNTVTITNGVVTAPTGTFSIGGSFEASSGTFVHNNGTVRMTATTQGKVVTPGSNSFFNLVFSGSGGGWGFGQAYATTSNNFQILGGTVTLPSTKLYVAGDFENEAGVFNANGGEVHMHTIGTQKYVEVNGSAFDDVRFTGVSTGSGDWYNTAWSHRFPITISSSQVDANLTDFPVYVDVAHFGDHFWNTVDEDGGDVRITAGDGITELPLELVNFATTTRTGQLYFEADALSDSSDTTFYVYYGNELASGYAEGDEYGSEAVWANGYLAVFHLDEDVAGSGNLGVYKDSTAFDEDGDDFLTTSAAAGQMGNAADMTPVGTSDLIRIPHTILNGETDVVVSWWMRTSDTGSQAVVSGAGSDNNEFLLFFNNSTTFVPYNSSNNVSFGISSIATNAWRYVVYEADDSANQSYLWIDGAPDNENPRAHTIGVLAISSGGLILGQEQDSVGGGYQDTQALDGYLDEIRFATTTRSNGWIATEYNNQYTPSSFYATSTYESIASRTFVDTNATVRGDVYIDSGLVTFPSGTFTLEGSLTNTTGIFDANNGTVLFATSSTGHTVAVGDSEFYNVTFNNSAGGWTITEDATSTNTWTITDVNDFTAQSGVRITVLGTFVNNDPSGTTWTGSTLSLKSGTGYTVGNKTQNAETYGTLHVGNGTHIRLWQSDATSYSVDATGSLYSQDHANQDGDLYIWGTYERTSGSDYWSYITDFDGTGIAGAPRIVSVNVADSSHVRFVNSTLEMKGAVTATTSVSNQGSGTYAFIFDSGIIDAEHFSVTDTGTDGLALLGSTTVTSLADGLFTLETNGGSMVTVSSTTIDTNPALQLQRNVFNSNVVSGYNVTASGTPTSYWWFRNHSGDFDGETNDNDSGNPGEIRWDDSGYTITVSGTVYAGEGIGGAGTVCDGVTPSVVLRVDGGTSYTSACDGGTGAYSIAGVSFSGDVPLIAYLDTTTTAQAATVSRTPTGNVTDFDIYENYVIVRHEDVDPITITHLARYDSTHDADIPFDASTTTDTFIVDADTALLVWNGKTFTPQGDITLNAGSGSEYDGTLVLQATSTFVARGGENHRIGGSWRSASDATFTASTSVVTFTASSSRSIQSYSNFYDVVLQGSGGSWSVDSDMVVTNDIALTQGTLSGTSHVTVENGTVTGNGTIAMSGGIFTIETGGSFGGDSDWSFDSIVFGDGLGGSTSKIGTGDIAVGDTLTVATNHTLDAGSVEWTLLGSGTVFSVSGTFTPSLSTVTYASTSAMTVATESYNNLILAPQGAGNPTYTFSAGVLNANTLTIGNGTNPVTATADTNDPLLTISGDVEVLANAVFGASGSNDLRIGGSFTNNGIFTSNGGGVVFNSTDTGETITSGGSSFHHVLFDGAGGGWTILGDATSTGNFDLQTGDSFTLTSGNTLEVQGVFTNGFGGITVWTDSTLYLNSGTGYSINTKSSGGDTYGTLKVGDTTDIRMWDSNAGTYDVSGTGSLYSMDHANVSGDLYIWGDFVQTTGSEYWSYATDFDGTDLSGGNERIVNVYLADNATTTLTGGTLEILGESSATTSIQNQGSGTFGMEIAGGTFSAGYYRIRDMGEYGLSFSGSPVIQSLSDGDLMLQNSGGSMMTIASSVLDANPVKTWYRITFATSTGVSSGANVTVTGDSITSWRFTPAQGNYYGEAYDLENGGDPGYIVWDDSNANITIQGNVYSDESGTVSGVCNGSTPVVRLLVEGGSPQTVPCAAGTGLYQVTGIIYSPGDTITVYLDTNGGVQASTVTVSPVSSIYDMHLYERRVVVRHEDVDPISIADMSVYDSDNDSDILFDADTGSPNTLTMPADSKLIVWGGKDFAPGGDVTLSSGSGNSYDGTFELKNSASLIASTTLEETFTIGGSWLTGTGATFESGSSTVAFTATTTGKIVSPDTSPFHTLTFNGVGGAWVFEDRNATTTDDFSIVNGTVTLGTSTLAVGGSFINSATMSSASTSMRFLGDATHTVAFNGYAVGSITFDGSGEWTMTDSNATSTGAVTIEEGTVHLPSGVFSVRDGFSNDGGSFTHSGTVRLYGSLAGQTLLSNGSSLHNLSIEGSGSWIMTDTHATTTGTTTVKSGGLTAPSEHFGIGGSFENSSTFNSNGGLMYFFATSTGMTIDTGGSVLADVMFNGVGGGWRVATSATSTGYWRLQQGTAFEMASSSILEVQGVFSNFIGGLGTNWTDATLFLNASGTSYTVNTKSVGGDQYAFLRVGDNTDVRMWNSGATTTVSSTGSLYSMNHGSVPGDLYIWGDYTRTNGTDYWSYATDFDGAALGGSARQVDVRIASSSDVTFSGTAGLYAVGSAGATTTIAVQDSGTYGVSFRGSIINMQYYQVRNTDANGLVISGTPTVSSMNNGDFELSIDDGVLLSVASSTINQNPTKTIANVWFGTTTGVATGTNVKADGTTANYWIFTPSFGVFEGEYHDDDGTDECGSIRWSDSICLEVSQAHYRFRLDDGGEGAPDNEWFDQDWSHRKRVTVRNPNTSTLTDYPVRIALGYEAEMQSDFDDLRFTDESGTTTLEYYVESYVTSATATVWVKVPTIGGSNTADIYVYYGNSFAANGEDGESTFIAFDDFEDNSLTEYSGDTSLFSPSGSLAWQGSYGLSAASGETESQTTDGIYRTDQTIPQGSTIEFYQRVQSGQDDEPCAYFGVQSGNSGNYAVCLDQFPNDRVIVVEDVTSNDGSGNLIASSSITYTSGTEWYKVRVDWLTDDSIDVTVYDSDGTSVATINDSDGTYDSGGYGFGFWYQAQGWDFFSVRPYAQSEPTYTVSTPQQGGGASWKAAQDTPINQDSNTNFRVRMSIENSGPQIASQQFRIQYAPKTGHGSCESVPSVSYNDVPSVASCGVSPLCMVGSGQFIDQDETSQLLITSSALAFTPGYLVEDPSNQTTAMDVATSTLTELEYAVELTSFATESSYCLRATNGGVELDSYARIPEVSVNGLPVITSWSLNNDSPIFLTEGETTVVVATGSVTDLNGFTDLLYATTTIYRSGVGNTCTADDNNCYHLNSLQCPFQNCAGNTCDVECTANIQFFAEPTDLGSLYEGETWEAHLFVMDFSSNVATSTSSGVELHTLLGLSLVTGEISYGSVELGADTGSVNATTTVQNTGNDAVDVDIEGSDMTSGGSTIPVSNQRYATSSFTYSSCTICNALSGTASTLEVDLAKPASTTPVTDDIYWGIYVPIGVEGTTHYGQNTFYATYD